MHARRLVALLVAVTVAVVSGVAAAGTMHPRLAARLSGMGEHGVVNFQSQETKGKLCWTFSLHTMGVTGASIRDLHGMRVAALGARYTATGCATVAKRALQLIEAHPARYVVWVDTKGHPGDLRGKLFVGMAHM